MNRRRQSERLLASAISEVFNDKNTNEQQNQQQIKIKSNSNTNNNNTNVTYAKPRLAGDTGDNFSTGVATRISSQYL